MKYTRKTVFYRLAEHISIQKRLMFYCGAIALLLSIITTIQPYLYKILVDDVMTEGKINLLSMVISEMIVVYMIRVLISVCSTVINKKFADQTNLEVKNRLMKKLLDIDMRNVKNSDVGEQSNNLEEDSKAVYGFLASHIVEYCNSFIIVGTYWGLMLCVDIWLGIISVIILPLVIIFSKKIGEKLNDISKERFEVTSRTTTYLFDTLQKWREIKINTLEEQFTIEYDNRLEPEREINCKWILYYAFRDAVYLIKDAFFMKVLIYFLGGLFIILGDISIGELLMFVSYMKGMNIALEKIMRSNSDFLGQKSTFNRLFKILDEREMRNVEMCPENPTIIFRNVDFSYEGTQDNLFKGINCSFSYGKKYLMVGKSGEGKTTLINLLLGINKVKRGEITVNDIPICRIDSKCFLKKIGVVMQDNFFFNLSIRENFLLIAPKASDKEIGMALRLACIDKFIDSLPQKIDTIIGERGIKLSGGQKQRLAIARLILHNPSVVILDEATSALDSIDERRILYNLNNMFKEETLIVISHKPLTSYHNDYTLRIEEGKILCEIS